MHDTGQMDHEIARPSDVPAPLRLAAAYVWRLLLLGVGVYALLWVLNYFTSLVVPFLVAVLLAAMLAPLVNLLTRWVPRAVAVLIAVVLAIAAISGLFTLVGTQISSQFGELTRQAMAGVTKLQVWLAEGPLHLGSKEVTGYLEQATQALSENSSRLAGQALSVTATAGEVLTGLVLALFTLIFLLLDGRGIWRWLLNFVPRAGRERADVAGLASWQSLTAYVRATVLVAFVDAVGIGIGAVALGVPLAVPLAVLVFLGAFIPIVGALVSGAVAVFVALITLGFVKALIMLAVVIGVQQLESHILQPFLMGRMVAIHPLAIVFAIGAGIIVDGITGALFAVPLVAALNTFVKTVSNPALAPTSAGARRGVGILETEPGAADDAPGTSASDGPVVDDPETSDARPEQ